jgi:hypothetical protein
VRKECAHIWNIFFSAVNFFSAEHIPNRGLKGIHHISQKAKMNFSQAWPTFSNICSFNIILPFAKNAASSPSLQQTETNKVAKMFFRHSKLL